MPAPCNAKPISLGFTPWNEICPKKDRSHVILVVQSWQNYWNVRYAIPLGHFAPCIFAMSYELSAICCPHRASVGGAFLRLFCRMTLGFQQETQNMCQTKI